MSGFVLLYRSLLGHPAFRNDAESMSFAWMVLRAAWQPCTVRYKERPIRLERGQLALSVRDMATHLDRSKDWAKRFLDRCTSRDMIATDSATGVTIITIRNYDKYQPDLGMGATPIATAPRHDRDTTATQNNELNEGNKEYQEATPPVCALPRTPIAEAVAFWNEQAGEAGWATIRSLSDDRRSKLKSRLNSETLDGWKAAIIRARSSPYLGHDPPAWFTFDWIIKPTNFLKLTEGNYDRQRSDHHRQPQPSGWEAAYAASRRRNGLA